MKKEKIDLSIISPVFQAEEIIDELIIRIEKELYKLDKVYEIILVDDGSLDSSWFKIKENSEKNKKIKGIKLSKNFGQAYAISAGLKECKGKCSIVIDCDLQENPKYISKLLEKYNEGYEIVLSIFKKRKHNFFKNLTSILYYGLLNFLLEDKSKRIYQYGTFSLLSRNVIDTYTSINDYHRHYLSIVRWLGYKSANILIEHDKRFIGNSSYSFKGMLKLALNGIISQTDRLLRFSIYIGFLLSMIGFLSIVFILIKYFFDGFQAGWPSIAILIIFSTGLILISLGIVGIYIGKIFEQTKNRPLYIIEETVNMKED